MGKTTPNSSLLSTNRPGIGSPFKSQCRGRRLIGNLSSPVPISLENRPDYRKYVLIVRRLASDMAVVPTSNGSLPTPRDVELNYS